MAIANSFTFFSPALAQVSFNRQSQSGSIINPPVLEPQNGGGPPPVIQTTAAPMQMRKWNLLPVGLNFTTAPLQFFANPNTVQDNNLSAAAFDEDDKTLFFIKYGAQASAGLYDANGILRATIPPYRSLTVNDGNAVTITYDVWGREMAVVPVPGACKQFYVFYWQSKIYNGSSSCNCPSYSVVLLKTIIDCSGTVPALLSQPTPVAELFARTTDNFGIAVSKKTNGTRWLYFRGFETFRAYPITSMGVGNAVVFPATSPSASTSMELDLSPDGTKIAAASGPVYNGQTFLADVDPATGAVTNPRFVTPPGTSYGVEFSPDSKTLYISGTYTLGSVAKSGVYTYAVATSQLAFVIATDTRNLHQTSLELGLDGKIYGCTSTGLLAIDPANNTVATPAVSPVVAIAPSLCSPLQGSGTKGYVLPDQIDGEDYTFFFDVPAPTVSSMQVDGKLLNNGVYRNLYTCQPALPVTATLANITDVRIIIRPTDRYSGTPTGATSLTSAWLPANTAIDLLTLFGPNYFVTNPGFYQLAYEGRNACRNVRRQTGLFRIGGQLPASPFQFKSGQENANVEHYNTSAAAPANVGGLGGAVQLLDPANGNIFDSYSATIERYNSGTLALVGTATTVPITPGTYVLKLNDIAAQALGTGVTDYFAQPANLNKVFKISLTLQNVCGTSSTSAGFFSPVSAAYRAAPGAASGQVQAATLALYPNPSTAPDGNVRLAYNLPSAQTVRIRLLNTLTGQHCPDLLPQQLQQAGVHSIEIDLSALPAGQYVAELLGERRVRLRFAKAD